LDRYSARIPPSASIAEDVSYDALVESLRVYVLRAAFAHAADEHGWEQEELRRHGLRAVELFRNARAVWGDEAGFEGLRAEEARQGLSERFERQNELDPQLFHRLERDLRERFRLTGYLVEDLGEEMKVLFEEIEADARDRERDARDELLAELLGR